jgi:hypothetical protein
MALQKTVNTPHGFEAINAYHRVEGVRLQDKVTIAFQVRSYKSKDQLAAFNDELHSCEYDLDGSNPIAQAYEHLKTVPEFSDATDC